LYSLKLENLSFLFSGTGCTANEECIICTLPILQGSGRQISDRSLPTIFNAAQKREDDLKPNKGDNVHITCYRDYTNEKRIKSAMQQGSCHLSKKSEMKRSLRSEEAFDFKPTKNQTKKREAL
jgi:hypothetical protein